MGKVQVSGFISDCKAFILLIWRIKAWKCSIWRKFCSTISQEPLREPCNHNTGDFIALLSGVPRGRIPSGSGTGEEQLKMLPLRDSFKEE